MGVDIVTLGQYLRPTHNHLPIERFVTPEEFDSFRASALRKGSWSVCRGRWCVRVIVRSRPSTGTMRGWITAAWRSDEVSDSGIDVAEPGVGVAYAGGVGTERATGSADAGGSSEVPGRA